MKRWPNVRSAAREDFTLQDAINEARTASGIDRTFSGPLLRSIRERCGYSAREFAEFLALLDAPITTTRSVYRLEAEQEVAPRYVDAMRAFVGPINFDHTLQRLDEEAEVRRRRNEEAMRRTAELQQQKHTKQDRRGNT